MKFALIFFLLFSNIFSSDFITKKEYAKRLYSNPRGIGCDKCHGSDGSGGFISNYEVYNKKTKKFELKKLFAPNLKNISFEEFKKNLKKSPGFMPSYFLTDDEIKILYEFINTKEKNVKKNN